MQIIQNWQQISSKYLDPQSQYTATVIHPLKKAQTCNYCQYQSSIIISISKKQMKKLQSSYSMNSKHSSTQSQIELSSYKQTHVDFITKICYFIKQIIIRLFIFLLLISVIVEFDFYGVYKTHYYDLISNKYDGEHMQIPENIKHVIYDYANNIDQFNAAMQAYSAMVRIKNCANKEQCAMSYKSIVRSIECLHFTDQYNYENIYGKIQDILLNTLEDVDKYFEMLENFNGEAFKLSQPNQLGSACLFQIQQTNIQSGHNLSKSQNTSTVINIQTVAYGPLHLFKNILSLMSNLRYQNKFDVVNFIIKKKEQPRGFYKKIVQNFQKTEKANRHTQFQLCKCLIICLQNFDKTNYHKKLIQNQLFDELYLSFKKTIIEDGVKNKTMYDFDKTKDFVVQQIQEGSKVIITSYSESTILTNNIYESMSIEEKQNVGLAYVSPLVDKIPDQKGYYIYSSSDQINLKLSEFVKEKGYISQPLQPNQPQIQNCSDCKGDLQKIIGQIQEIIQNLTNITEEKILKPTQQLGKGNITVQLKWDKQPDVDLHIWEPTGDHVFYGLRQGQCGYLDRDDTDGQGPEHYYTSTEKFIPGTYIFKLNYYRGGSATKTLVTVSAGPQYFTKQLTLHPALGGSGSNNPPYHICSVETARNKQGFYSFKIIP